MTRLAIYSIMNEEISTKNESKPKIYQTAKNITTCRRHKIVVDWIDITPDHSQAIWYCEKCGYTSTEYNKK